MVAVEAGPAAGVDVELESHPTAVIPTRASRATATMRFMGAPEGVVGSARKPDGARISVGVRRDNLSDVPGGQSMIGDHVDRVFQEFHGAVTEQEVGASRVVAPESELAEIEASRILRRVGSTAVDPSRSIAVGEGREGERGGGRETGGPHR